MQGGDIPAVKRAGLPGLHGTFGGNMYGKASGAFSFNATTKGYSDGTGLEQGTVTFSADRSNDIFGSSDTVQPPAIVLIPQVRF